MESIGNPWLYIAFFAIVMVMLLIDFLGFKQKEGQEVKVKPQRTGVLLGLLLPHYLVAGCGTTYNKQQVSLLQMPKPWNISQVIYWKNPSQSITYLSG